MGKPVKSLTPAATVDRGHEPTDVNVRPLLIFLFVMTLLLIAVFAVVAWLFDDFLADLQTGDRTELAKQAEVSIPIEGPPLQVSPQFDMDQLRRRDDQRLHATDWVDPNRHIARIPIDEAMSLVLERGLPKWPPAEVGPPGSDTSGAAAPAPASQGAQTQASPADSDAGGAPQ